MSFLSEHVSDWIDFKFSFFWRYAKVADFYFYVLVGIFHAIINLIILILQEAAEVKRKNTKRTFKSEKEFLEFTLKYHQVIAERDSGK